MKSLTMVMPWNPNSSDGRFQVLLAIYQGCSSWMWMLFMLTILHHSIIVAILGARGEKGFASANVQLFVSICIRNNHELEVLRYPSD